jgi:putative transposase
MLISLAYRLTRRLLGAAATIARRDVAKDAELLVVRHGNAVLRRHVDRVRYGAGDRLWFAALSSLVPGGTWAEVFPVTPATVPAWHRSLVAGKYTTAPRRPGRPSTAGAIRTLVIRMAADNPPWGHRRVQGESARLGHPIAASTVWQILRAPRKPCWAKLCPAPLRGHGLGACPSRRR